MKLRHTRWALAAALLGGLTGFGCATGGDTTSGEGAWGGTSSGGQGGTAGGGGASPCEQDCTQMPGVPTCYEGVCDTSQDPPACAIQMSASTTECDDGQFCTVGDHCQDGECISGTTQNDCGQQGAPCTNVVCNEASDSCTQSPKPVNTMCDTGNLCEVSGSCNALGECEGTVNDCYWSDFGDCQVGVCDQADGVCKAQPANEGGTCIADLCNLNGLCDATGTCTGTTLKNCAHLNLGCANGVCDVASGNCTTVLVAEGEECFAGSDSCNTGLCSATSTCVPTPLSDNTSCSDFSVCTSNDVCTAGACGGTAVPSCPVYLEFPFESGCPPADWTLQPDWECGTPSLVGPTRPYSGARCLGTNLDGNYSANRAYATSYAQTPSIDLTGATAPTLSFRAWMQTEAYAYDAYNVAVSTDGGTTFAVLSTVTPPYTGTVASQTAWYGDQSAAGWRFVSGNLAAYVNQQIILRFQFRSDGGTQYPGVYIDDVRVSEPAAIPLDIQTTTLPKAAVDAAYSVQITKMGGSNNVTWSIVSGGTNDGWLSIGSTGLLSGTPTSANLGAVTVTLRVAEPSLPSNFAEKTFTFNVIDAIYFESFEGTCPNGWTLTGDWQCGVPSSVGPATAYGGAQCIATIIAGNYNNSNAWATTTATSPSIDLTGTVAPQATWRMWVNTEGSIYDGANLKVSTNDGASWQMVTTVSPAYTLTISTETAWGGDLSANGWQAYSANLTAFAGQPIRLRFAFRSDTSGVDPGVYIDDLFVTD
jgi:hypothetical protein